MNLNEPILKNEVFISKSEKAEMICKSTPEGKSCSICGTWFPSAQFSYGSRVNRSYCQQCNVKEKNARTQGGSEAAREFREEMRQKFAQS